MKKLLALAWTFFEIVTLSPIILLGFGWSMAVHAFMFGRSLHERIGDHANS